MRYGIIGEADSDVLTLKELVARLHERLGLAKPGFETRGFGGCAKLLRSGAKQLELYEAADCERLVVYDADRDDPAARRRKALTEVVEPAKLTVPCFVCVPVQEIEAWLLADTAAVTRVVPRCRDLPEYASPEHQNDPKEELKRICRDPKTRKSIYDTATHNEKVAKYLDLDALLQKCPTARELAEFVAAT